MPKTFVVGDIHGAHKALLQCLERAKFDYQNDHLISLGDVCDGWPDTRACIDELIKVNHLTYIFGNHDMWTLEWMQTGDTDDIWLKQGGEATIKSYASGIPIEHVQFLDDALPYYVENDKLFVHAGFDPKTPIDVQGLDIFLWDRELARIALEFFQKNMTTKLTSYGEVYVGHTVVPSSRPLSSCGLWLMDTGAGWSGPLSIMNIQTKEIFQSDPVPTLYPGVQPRKKS
jgi:serine/threonine protein phosphatase 1